MGRCPSAAAAGDWWDPNNEGLCVLAAWQGKGAASYAASKVNLANPGTYDLTEVGGAVNWTSGSGWYDFDILSRCFDTGVVPTSQSWSYLAQFANATTDARAYWFGVYDAYATTVFIRREPDSTNLVRLYNSFGAAVPLFTTGNAAMAKERCFKDGVYQVSTPVNWNALTNSIHLGAIIQLGVVQGYISGSIYAEAFYNCILTDPQVAAVAAAMAAL